jgi:hypothetical protein
MEEKIKTGTFVRFFYTKKGGEVMKKYLFLLMVVFCLFFSVVSSKAFASDPMQDTVNERVIVGFHDEIDLNVFNKMSYELHHIFDEITAVSVTVPRFAISYLNENSKVAWVESDPVVKTSGQLVDWGHKVTGTKKAQDLGLTGAGVRIAIIDTGVSKQHPDLTIAGGKSFVEGSASYHDNNGHGTHVAGIIAAQNNGIGSVGVAPGAEIYAIKSLDEEGDGNQADVIAGIEWAIENNIDIINLSITSPFATNGLRSIIEKANDKGILVIAASGNDETGNGQIGNDIMYPARYPTVIGVGAINKEKVKPSFSYMGPSLEYAAPGERVYSTYVGGNGTDNGYAYMSGTSMATPYVAGVLALYKEAFPSLSIQTLKKITSRSALDLGTQGRDPVYGYGLIQSPSMLFWDLKDNVWYSSYIKNMIEKDLVSGYVDGTFRPNGNITREEVVTMIGRALKLDGTKREAAFTDVKPEYFGSGYIASATEKGYISGYPGNTFKPKSSITRGDVAVIIQKAFGFPLSTNQVFTDVKSNKYYFEEVNALNENKIISGYPDNSFLPDQNISRAEFSIILAKALDPSLR